MSCVSLFLFVLTVLEGDLQLQHHLLRELECADEALVSQAEHWRRLSEAGAALVPLLVPKSLLSPLSSLISLSSLSLSAVHPCVCMQIQTSPELTASDRLPQGVHRVHQ